MIFSFIFLYFWITAMGCTIGKEDAESGGKLVDSTLLPKSVIVDISDSQTSSEKPTTPDKT